MNKIVLFEKGSPFKYTVVKHPHRANMMLLHAINIFLLNIHLRELVIIMHTVVGACVNQLLLVC